MQKRNPDSDLSRLLSQIGPQAHAARYRKDEQERAHDGSRDAAGENPLCVGEGVTPSRSLTLHLASHQQSPPPATVVSAANEFASWCLCWRKGGEKEPMMGTEGWRAAGLVRAQKLSAAQVLSREAGKPVACSFLCNQKLYWLGPSAHHHEHRPPGLRANGRRRCDNPLLRLVFYEMYKMYFFNTK